MIETMREVFPEAMVTGHESLVSTMLNDTKDRYVLAAVSKAAASVIVTENLRDFLNEALTPLEIEVWSIDTFLAHLESLAPQAMRRIVREQAADLQEPPMSFSEALDMLEGWAPTFVNRLR